MPSLGWPCYLHHFPQVKILDGIAKETKTSQAFCKTFAQFVLQVLFVTFLVFIVSRGILIVIVTANVEFYANNNLWIASSLVAVCIPLSVLTYIFILNFLDPMHYLYKYYTQHMQQQNNNNYRQSFKYDIYDNDKCSQRCKSFCFSCCNTDKYSYKRAVLIGCIVTFVSISLTTTVVIILGLINHRTIFVSQFEDSKYPLAFKQIFFTFSNQFIGYQYRTMYELMLYIFYLPLDIILSLFILGLVDICRQQCIKKHSKNIRNGNIENNIHQDQDENGFGLPTFVGTTTTKKHRTKSSTSDDNNVELSAQLLASDSSRAVNISLISSSKERSSKTIKHSTDLAKKSSMIGTAIARERIDSDINIPNRSQQDILIRYIWLSCSWLFLVIFQLYILYFYNVVSFNESITYYEYLVQSWIFMSIFLKYFLKKVSHLLDQLKIECKYAREQRRSSRIAQATIVEIGGIKYEIYNNCEISFVLMIEIFCNVMYWLQFRRYLLIFARSEWKQFFQAKSVHLLTEMIASGLMSSQTYVSVTGNVGRRYNTSIFCLRNDTTSDYKFSDSDFSISGSTSTSVQDRNYYQTWMNRLCVDTMIKLMVAISTSWFVTLFTTELFFSGHFLYLEWNTKQFENDIIKTCVSIGLEILLYFVLGLWLNKKNNFNLVQPFLVWHYACKAIWTYVIFWISLIAFCSYV